MIKFQILGEPVPKGRPRFTRRGICYTPARTREAETNFLAQAVQYAPEKPLTKPLSVIIKVFKPKPKTKPKKIKHWTTRPDLDNYVKGCLDPLNGVFWLDDSQIIKINASKEYGEPARTEIEISEIDE